MSNDTPFVVRAYNLGLKAVSNFHTTLTAEQLEYYEQHLGEIPNALRRGFSVPASGELPKTTAYLRRLYETEVVKLGEKVFAVYEMTSNGTFAQIFGSLGDNLNLLAFESRDQVDEFCRVHPGKLRSGGYATFFLYKKGEEFLVAYVFVFDDGRLYVLVYPLEFARVWYAKYQHRIVVPQL